MDAAIVEARRRAGVEAAALVEEGMIVGLGTGDTAAHALRAIGERVRGGLRVSGVATSRASEELARSLGIAVRAPDDVAAIDLTIDGADEIDEELRLIKGGGGALTREKIVAAVSRKFVCVADESKLVEALGRFPLPVEVIPMARSYVARECVKLGGIPEWRQGFVTDNGNAILDVYNLEIPNPAELESTLNQIPGVVTNGLFARRGADVLLLGTPGGVQTFVR